MEQIEQTHHIHDVGRILLQTQQELALMREQIALKRSTTEAGSSLAASRNDHNSELANDFATRPSEFDTLQAIIEKAEKDIQAKVNLVLKGVVRNNQNTHTILPAVASPTVRMSVEKNSAAMFSESQDVMIEDIRQRFREANAESAPRRPPNRKRNAKIVKRKMFESARLLPDVKRSDGNALYPDLGESDAKRGILSLINRGFVSAHSDLSPAFTGGFNSVLVQRSVRLHDRSNEPIKSIPCMNETGFNVAALRFDMSPAKPIDTIPHLRPEKESSHMIEQPSSSNDQVEAEHESIVAPDVQDTPESGPVQAEISSSDSISDLRNNIDKIRHYNELLDAYSLHQLIIHKGITLTKTPEYVSFKRVTEESWGDVEDILRRLEKILDDYAVPLAYIDGQRILNLAQMQSSTITKDALLSCIMNKEQVEIILRTLGQRYKGRDRTRKAAIAIQAFFRMYTARRRYKAEQRFGKCVIRIQTSWRMVFAYRRTKQRLIQIRQQQLEKYTLNKSRFCMEWQTIRKHPRTIIHIPSISIPSSQRLCTDQYSIKQNLQLARVCAVFDSNVEIVYVSPFELPKDISQYYLKLLQLNGIHDAGRRVKFIHPENVSRFPDHFSLATVVLYSPQILARLKRYIRGKEAYLVPGIPSVEEKRLAMALEVPLLGLDVTRSFQLLTHSGSKRIFAKADVHSTGGTLDICDEDELYFSFAKLLLQDYRQNIWVLKLDYDPLDAGIALVDVSQLPFILRMRAEKMERYWKNPAGHARSVRVLTEEIRHALPKLLKPVYPEIFRSWKQFRRAFLQFGVTIEAKRDHLQGFVRANLFIDPSKAISLTSTHNVILSDANNGGPTSAARLRVLGYEFPQTVVPYEALQGASMAIATELLKEDLYGFISIDFVAYLDNATEKRRLCAITIKPYLTDSAASFALFHFLNRGGLINSKTGFYHMPPPSQAADIVDFDALSSLSTAQLMLREASIAGINSQLQPSTPRRSYIVFNYLYNSNIASVPYKSFFRICRSNGIHFDVQRAVGTMFTLADSLASGVFGVLCIGESRKHIVSGCFRALEVIAREIGPQTYSSIDAMDNDGSEVMSMRNNFYEVFRFVRLWANQNNGNARPI